MKTSKTIQFFFLSLMTGVILLSSCKKDEPDMFTSPSQHNAAVKSATPGIAVASVSNWREDFSTADALALRWTLYGTPQPQWVSFAGNRFGLFDNNGRLPNGSYAVSKTKIGNGQGYIIESEVFIDAANPNATVICPEIGVTRYFNPGAEPVNVEAGISMRLMYVGDGATSVPPALRKHTYIVMSALLSDRTYATTGNPLEATSASKDDYAMKADFAGNGWHKLRIVVSASSRVSFYLDNQLVWTPAKAIHTSLMADKNVLLGFTSPGTTGKAYHDYVKVSYPLQIAEDTTIDPPAPIE
ncbi:MAG: hypothetical protein WCR72_11155 [Bacteroidota bacterium]